MGRNFIVQTCEIKTCLKYQRTSRLRITTFVIHKSRAQSDMVLVWQIRTRLCVFKDHSEKREKAGLVRTHQSDLVIKS